MGVVGGGRRVQGSCGNAIIYAAVVSVGIVSVGGVGVVTNLSVGVGSAAHGGARAPQGMDSFLQQEPRTRLGGGGGVQIVDWPCRVSIVGCPCAR